MAGGYQVGIASETKAFKQGVESGIIEPLEDAQKELVELGRARGPEQLERSMKDAERATEKLGDETKRTARDIEREFKDSYRKVKRDADDAFDGATKGAEDFRDEANSTAREAAASFDGSAESIVDAFQEVAANAFEGFGPAGAVAGLAAAAGIGLAMAGFEDVQEAQEQAAELASEWAERYIESGQRVATAAQQTAQIVNISTDPELYKEATENSKLWGVSLEEAMLAMSGNAAAAEVVADALDRKRVATEKDALAADEAARANGGVLLSTTPMQAELAAAENAWKKHTDAMSAGALQADATSDALLRIVDEAAEAGVQVDELGNQVVTLPGGAEILIDAKTGKASADVSKFKGDTDDTIDYLNGRDIVLEAKATTRAAQDEVNRFVSRNNGRTIRLHGRFDVAPIGGDL